MTRNWEGPSSKVNNFNIWGCAASKNWHSNWRVENWRWQSEVSENYNPDFLLEKLIWIQAHPLMRLPKKHSVRKTWKTAGSEETTPLLPRREGTAENNRAKGTHSRGELCWTSGLFYTNAISSFLPAPDCYSHIYTSAGQANWHRFMDAPHPHTLVFIKTKFCTGPPPPNQWLWLQTYGEGWRQTTKVIQVQKSLCAADTEEQVQIPGREWTPKLPQMLQLEGAGKVALDGGSHKKPRSVHYRGLQWCTQYTGAPVSQEIWQGGPAQYL